ncbi:Na(+)/H(+) antiporter subunit F1 [Bacillus sp. Marseille-P3661]|uniref:Na(+)/H(+) antiporter subunit F1 n=1 Tax=Bacillus sp. Marseille-P3661 TaxID=1936234 RepID=UPI000C84AEAA|nr:Na(+)/H(+) antiporter subunit F1 [Bacillus sp. Marseille-P3661]
MVLALQISLLIFSLAALTCVYRLIKGPSTPDRIMALDSIGIILICIVAIISVLLNTDAYLDVILLIGGIAFIGTVAFSKFLEKGVVIENDRNNS